MKRKFDSVDILTMLAIFMVILAIVFLMIVLYYLIAYGVAIELCFGH